MLYKFYIYTFKKIEKLNKMTNAYNNISKLNITPMTDDLFSDKHCETPEHGNNIISNVD